MYGIDLSDILYIENCYNQFINFLNNKNVDSSVKGLNYTELINNPLYYDYYKKNYSWLWIQKHNYYYD